MSTSGKYPCSPCVSENAASAVSGEVRYVQPEYQLSQQGEAAVVDVLLPGFTKDAISVTHAEGILIVEAERSPESLLEGAQWLINEQSPTHYRLRLRLERSLDGASAQAEYRDGVLTIQVFSRKNEQTETIAII